MNDGWDCISNKILWKRHPPLLNYIIQFLEGFFLPKKTDSQIIFQYHLITMYGSTFWPSMFSLNTFVLKFFLLNFWHFSKEKHKGYPLFNQMYFFPSILIHERITRRKVSEEFYYFFLKKHRMKKMWNGWCGFIHFRIFWLQPVKTSLIDYSHGPMGHLLFFVRTQSRPEQLGQVLGTGHCTSKGWQSKDWQS